MGLCPKPRGFNAPGSNTAVTAVEEPERNKPFADECRNVLSAEMSNNKIKIKC